MIILVVSSPMSWNMSVFSWYLFHLESFYAVSSAEGILQAAQQNPYPPPHNIGIFHNKIAQGHKNSIQPLTKIFIKHLEAKNDWIPQKNLGGKKCVLAGCLKDIKAPGKLQGGSIPKVRGYTTHLASASWRTAEELWKRIWACRLGRSGGGSLTAKPFRSVKVRTVMPILSRNKQTEQTFHLKGDTISASA